MLTLFTDIMALSTKEMGSMYNGGFSSSSKLPKPSRSSFSISFSSFTLLGRMRAYLLQHL